MLKNFGQKILSFELEFCNGKMTTIYVVRDAYLELFDLLNFRRHFTQDQQQTIPPIRQAIFHKLLMVIHKLTPKTVPVYCGNVHFSKLSKKFSIQHKNYLLKELCWGFFYGRLSYFSPGTLVTRVTSFYLSNSQTWNRAFE